MKSFKGKKVYHGIFETDDGKEYVGYCDKKTKRCHGYGKMVEKNSSGKIYSIREGEWINGTFYKGTYSMPPPPVGRKDVGYFKIGSDGDDALHGEGVEYYSVNSLKNFKEEKWIGHVKGTFKKGRLVKGEILNPSLIKYSEHKGIKKIIHYSSTLGKNTIGESAWIYKGKIFYEIDPKYKSKRPEEQPTEYEGKIDFDVPHGKGTMKFKDGSQRTGIWDYGSIGLFNPLKKPKFLLKKMKETE